MLSFEKKRFQFWVDVFEQADPDQEALNGVYIRDWYRVVAGPIESDSPIAATLSRHQLTLLFESGVERARHYRRLDGDPESWRVPPRRNLPVIFRRRPDLRGYPYEECFQGRHWVFCERYFPEINPERAPQEVRDFFERRRLEQEEAARIEEERREAEARA